MRGDANWLFCVSNLWKRTWKVKLEQGRESKSDKKENGI